MSNHSSKPENMTENQEQLLGEKLGATGKFPHGKLTPDDEGELRLAVYRRGDKVVVDFGTTTSWIALTADSALALSESLIKFANFVRAGN